MIVAHALGIVAVTGVVVVCTVLPFLPGRYDGLAVPVAGMAQVLGITGLLMVPIGGLWIGSAYVNSLRSKQYIFPIAALVVSSLVWAAVSLAALVSVGYSLALCSVAVWGYALSRLVPRVRRMRTAANPAPNALALYAFIVPIAILVTQLMLVGPMTDSSRSRAIRNSEPLIADIERYRTAHGRYPASLLALWPDYLPGVVGVERFHYEPSGDAYNVFFEQFSFTLGTREIVMYNPRDEQAFSSHAMHLLQYTPEERELRRGYYAVRPASHPHWKSFLFD